MTACLLVNLVTVFFLQLPECTVSTLDIWFLIDGSGSIGETNFRECLNFVDKTAKAFEISSENVRAGLMIYESDTTLRSNLNEHQSNELFSSVVLSTPYYGGWYYELFSYESLL